MVRTYKRKPVVIEATQYDGTNFQELAEFVGKDLIANQDNEIFIRTLEGDMKVSINDYVIKGVKGEFYPCKPDVFESTYERF